MEDAVKALEMAFAVMVFMIALSVSMFSFNSAKATSDVMIYAQDETNYYDYQGATGKASENRIVGLETIVPTLYKYYKENYTVVFRRGNYDTATGELTNLEPLYVYKTVSTYKTSAGHYLWGTTDSSVSEEQSTYDTLMFNKYKTLFTSDNYYSKGTKDIFSFDLDEETLRHEPWTGSFVKARENLNCFLSGTIYNNPNNNSEYIDYGEDPLQTGGFVARYKNSKFIETIGEYEYNSSQQDTSNEGSSISSLVKPKKKRVIIFTLINNT